MAVQFQDPLSMWGTGSTSRTNMLNSSNGYIELGTSGSCETTQPRVGTHSWKAPSGTNSQFHYSLGGIKTSLCGAGAAVWMSSTPTASTALCSFMDSAGNAQCTLWVNPNGSCEWRISSSLASALIGSTSSAGLIAPNTFIHFEVKGVPGQSTAGSLYLRVNNKLVITATGIDNCQTANTNFASIRWFPTATGEMGIRYLADPYAWDDSGSYNNDWIGNKVSYPIKVDADTASADWTKNGATDGYDCIDDTAPDGASTYIEADNVNDESEFELEAPPSWLDNIVALTIVSVQALDSPGSSQTEMSLKSSASYAQGADRAISYPGFTAYFDHFERDPNGDIALTASNIGGMQIRAKRTA